jgi:hypothetical protein
MVLKPSEVSPLSAQLFAEFIEEAGFPTGVFNMVHGTGAMIGDALTGHPDVDMVSFTGSTRAGIQIAKSAAETVKRVSQELGGKSANIVFADSGLEKAVTRGVLHCFTGSLEIAREVIDAGWHLGIGGVVTYKNAQVIDVLREVGLDRVVLETDAPYLAPVPVRGQRNEPAHLALVRDFLASQLGRTAREIDAVTTANAQKVFTLAPSHGGTVGPV